MKTPEEVEARVAALHARIQALARAKESEMRSILIVAAHIELEALNWVLEREDG